MERMSGLECRDDPLEPRDLAEGRDRVVVGDRDVARAPGVAQPGVLRAGARVVEARGDRLRLLDLALVVLQQRAEGTVQHTRAPADRQRCAVAAGLDALA